jgi:hypothetical protein
MSVSFFIRRLVLALGLALAAPVSAQSLPSQPAAASAELTAEQWRADLRFMAAELQRRHANLYHTVSREAFAAAVADLDARIPGLQRNQIIAGMMRIVAMVGDGHTRIDPRKDPAFRFPSLPLRLYRFEDGLYVRAVRPDQRALLGARVEAIGGVPVAEAMRRAAALASRDNEIGARLFVPLYLAMPDLLHALGLSESREGARLTLSRGGRRWTVEVPAGQVDPSWPPDTDISLVTPDGWLDARTTTQPLWLQAPLEYHRLIELPARRALYAQLNMVTNIQGQTLDQFGRRIRDRAAAINPRGVILDLRLNQGGGGHLRNGLIRELIRTEDEDTRLFVLTARGTFSASQFILDDLDRLTGAIVIGEPAGSRPTHYGDAYRVTLPNSGIQLRISIWYWQEDQNFAPWTWVDLAAPLTFADYVAGRDPALEAALAFEHPPLLSDTVAAARRRGGVAASRAALTAFVEDPRWRYANLPRILVRTAETLHGANERDAALEVVAFAMARFPDAVDPALVYAMFAAGAGRTGDARDAAAQVLRLDPNNRQIRSVLERLGPSAPER